MKVRFLLGLLLVGVLMLPACAPKASELNLYAWSEYVPQELLDNFTTKTGIKVNYDTYSSNEEMLAKLQAGASGYDLVIPTDYTVDVMSKQGLIEPLDMTKIPNFVNIDPQFTNQYYDPGNKYSVPYMWGTTALAYVKNKVPFEPVNWADLWDPAFENQLVVLDDSREIPGMALMVLGYDKNSVNPEELEQAKQKLIALKPNIRLFDSDVPESALLTGEASAGLVYNGNAAIGHAEDENITYICPTEGCTLWIDSFVMPKAAPHKDAVMAFINFALEPAQSAIITANFPYSNPNVAALEYMKTNDPDAYAAYMDFPATNPSAEFLSGAIPTRDVGEATTLYDALWTDFKGE